MATKTWPTRGRTTEETRCHRRGVYRDLAVIAADGTRLLVDHHPPRPARDVPAGAVGGTVVWIRTPYGRKGVASFVKRFTKRGAHVLVEALRGTDGSGGTFDGITINPIDGADVAAWLRRQDWFPGTIVTWGPSFIGTTQWALAHTDVPEWRLAMVHDAQSEARATMWPGGVFAGVMLALLHAMDRLERHPHESTARNLLASLRGTRRANKILSTAPLGTADERLVGHRVEFFQDWLAHADDEDYWERLNLRPNAVRLPDQVHFTTGWYDTGLPSTLLDYAAARDAGKTTRLVVGPWCHGGGLMDKAHTRETDTRVENVARGAAALSRQSVRVHVGGADEWRDLPDWPPPGIRPAAWHLHPGGGLSITPAPASEPDRYRYDPADPTPAVGGAKDIFDGNAGAKDNRRLERRADVLTYTTDALADDVEMIGPVTAEIVLRSSLEHTDLFARLCDVDPKGRSINLCDGIRRLRPDDPPVEADGTRRVPVNLIATAHRFRRGHRIRLQVSSGAHPRLVRNTGTDAPLATATELRAADQEIFHDPEHVSAVILPLSATISAPSSHTASSSSDRVPETQGLEPDGSRADNRQMQLDLLNLEGEFS